MARSEKRTQNVNEPSVPKYPKEFRTCLCTYVVFGVMFGGMLALWLGGLIVRGGGPSSVWILIGVLTFSWAFTFFRFSRFRLLIDAESVTYSSLFISRKTFQRSEITHADFTEERGSFESPFTFVIRNKAGEAMRINAKVFSLEAVRELASLGKANAPMG
jgi:hypothetical protein